jgi:hypothetical protein
MADCLLGIAAPFDSALVPHNLPHAIHNKNRSWVFFVVVVVIASLK